MKNLTTIVLLVFVAVTVVYLVIGNRGTAPNNPREAATADVSSPSGVPESSGQSADSDAAGYIEQDRTNDVPATGSETESKTKTDTLVGHKVIAYYFHRTQRCHTCLTMETYAEQALKDAFPDALETGALEWRAVNVEEPKNEHFVKDYELYASALVIVDIENGQAKQSKELKQIWDLVGDEQKFKTFVRDEAQAYLEVVP